MAAQAWKLYQKAKAKIANGSMPLNGANFRIALVKSTSNFATATLSLFSSVTNEIASVTNAYSSSGKTLAGETWAMSGANAKFDVTDPVFTACGNPLGSIFGAVIFLSGATPHLLCYASLTGTPFALATGNTLTLQMNTAGVFVLS
jgi:hypothetical protein